MKIMEQCYWCDGTGKFKEPRDREKFEELLDKFEDSGTLPSEECRKRALDRVGYDLVLCKHCNGTGKRCNE